jgi:hypothetical protein
MKSSFIIFIILILFGCNQKRGNNQEQTKDTLIGHDTSSSTIVNNPNRNYLRLYIRNDRTPIYSAHTDSSKVLAYANYLDSFERYNFYYGYNGLTDKVYNTAFFPIKFNNDTAWISRSDFPALELKVQYFRNLKMIHFFSISEISGIGYSGTIVSDTITKVTLFDKLLKRDYSQELTQDRYLFNSVYQNGEILIYDFNIDTFQYTGRGSYPTKSLINPSIYFLREYSSDFKKIPLELVEYNYARYYENILYTEPSDSTYPCIYGPDAAECTDLKLSQKDSLEMISFELNQPLNNNTESLDGKKYCIEISNFKTHLKRIEK